MLVIFSFVCFFLSFCIRSHWLPEKTLGIFFYFLCICIRFLQWQIFYKSSDNDIAIVWLCFFFAWLSFLLAAHFDSIVCCWIYIFFSIVFGFSQRLCNTSSDSQKKLINKLGIATFQSTEEKKKPKQNKTKQKTNWLALVSSSQF